MCQLPGMNANTPTDVMFSFTGLASCAHEHRDGFGIASFESKALRRASCVSSATASARRCSRPCRRGRPATQVGSRQVGAPFKGRQRSEAAAARVASKAPDCRPSSACPTSPSHASTSSTATPS
ncbi:MAG: class II glutamine amidotransferase [Rubrivivax sp.]|nr:class II glutamine amidotransferase [Rubrivivax sp.]